MRVSSKMRLSPTTYTRLCLGVFFLVLGGLAVFNIYVDPQLAWGSPMGLEFLSHRTSHWEKATKAELLRGAAPDVLFIGSSMVENGIDPEFPGLNGRRAFNGGISGDSLKQSRCFLDYAFRVSKPSEVVLFIEFNKFNDELIRRVCGIDKADAKTTHPSEGSEWTHEDLNCRVNPEMDRVNYYISNAIGKSATEQSLELLANRRRGIAGVLRPNGVRDLDQDTDYRITRALLFKALGYFNEYADYGWVMGELNKVMEACRAHSSNLKIVISPLHAQYQECVNATGLWPQYEDWKRRLVEMVGRDRAAGGHCELWDASGSAGPLSEPLPNGREFRKKMQWYLEAFHFRKSLGREILREAYLAGPNTVGANSESAVHAGFDRPIAVRLNADNIEAHLATLRADRDDYTRTHPAEVALVRNLLRNLRIQSSWRVFLTPD